MRHPTSLVLDEAQHARLRSLMDRRHIRQQSIVLLEAIDKGLRIMEAVQDEQERVEALHVDAAIRARTAGAMAS